MRSSAPGVGGYRQAVARRPERRARPRLVRCDEHARPAARTYPPAPQRGCSLRTGRGFSGLAHSLAVEIGVGRKRSLSTIWRLSSPRRPRKDCRPPAVAENSVPAVLKLAAGHRPEEGQGSWMGWSLPALDSLPGSGAATAAAVWPEFRLALRLAMTHCSPPGSARCCGSSPPV